MRKYATFLVILLLCNFFLTVPVQATTISGTCGEGLSWTLDHFSGTLVISGTGPMTGFGPSYDVNISTPWYAWKSDIKTIRIESGVTTIGSYAFTACANLTQLSIADTVTTIGYNAFQNCRALTDLQLPASVTHIEEYAFSGCSFSHLQIPNSVESIGDFAFQSCLSLTQVEIDQSITHIGRKAFHDCVSLGHILYTGSKEQWDLLPLRSGTIPDGAIITYNYAPGMEYHIFDGDCDGQCNQCPFSREVQHRWDDGTVQADSTMLFTCILCGQTKSEGTPVQTTPSTHPSFTEPVPAESYQPIATTQPSPSEPQHPADADSSGLLLGIGAACLLLIPCVILLSRKKK